jgi:hypothetical protein
VHKNIKMFANVLYFQIVPRLCVNHIDFFMVPGDHMTRSDCICGIYLWSIS